nr:flavin reductase family protein [Flexivirga endophytica]
MRKNGRQPSRRAPCSPHSSRCALHTPPRPGPRCVPRRTWASACCPWHSNTPGACPARGVDRFADVDWRATTRRAVFLDGATALLETTVRDVVTAGDHDIVVLGVHDLDLDESRPPLVFHGSAFRRLAS